MPATASPVQRAYSIVQSVKRKIKNHVHVPTLSDVPLGNDYQLANITRGPHYSGTTQPEEYPEPSLSRVRVQFISAIQEPSSILLIYIGDSLYHASAQACTMFIAHCTLLELRNTRMCNTHSCQLSIVDNCQLATILYYNVVLPTFTWIAIT